MNSPTLFRAVAAAGLSLAVVACGPQEEPSSTEMSGIAAVESPVAQQGLSPDQARAAAAAVSGGTTDEEVVLGITYVRPHAVRPLRAAYAVPVTWSDSSGVLVRELIYVDVLDGSVLLRERLDETTDSAY
ncbi:hypothetical protein [Archangium violaceum]|uniref:hypothetical protein n=1 Tax=Archangium violaceum TaxID=83451 RepID=UPI0036D98E0D